MFDILVVEDSIDIQNLVGVILRPIATLQFATSIAQGLRAIDQNKFDLILMDVMLDDGGDGFTLTQLLRERPHGKDVPVIFMTSKDHIQDKERGFRLGAEDYIVKPFDRAEFKLRVESRLEKIAAARNKDQLIRGNLRLETALQKSYLIKEDVPLNLTPLEFKILYFLMNRQGDVVSRDDLSRSVWGAETPVGRSMDTHVHSLRRKLGDYSSYIQSVYGSGYTFQDQN